MFLPYIDTNNPQGMQLRRFKNRTPARFEYIYCTFCSLCHSNQDTSPFLKDPSSCPCFCFVHTIAQFSRILRFSHIYCQMFRIGPSDDGSDVPLNSECITSTIGSENWRTELLYGQNKNRGEKMGLLGMNTCPSLNDIMDIRCNKCTRSEQGYDF